MEGISSFVREGKLVIGSRETLKLLKENKIKKVYVASTCPKETLDFLKEYAKKHKVEIVYLKENAREFGKMLGKPFIVSIAGVKHGEGV